MSRGSNTDSYRCFSFNHPSICLRCLVGGSRGLNSSITVTRRAACWHSPFSCCVQLYNGKRIDSGEIAALWSWTSYCIAVPHKFVHLVSCLRSSALIRTFSSCWDHCLSLRFSFDIFRGDQIRLDVALPLQVEATQPRAACIESPVPLHEICSFRSRYTLSLRCVECLYFALAVLSI